MPKKKLKQEENCRKNERKYYRFRADSYYGGIATADCKGCKWTVLSAGAGERDSIPE